MAPPFLPPPPEPIEPPEPPLEPPQSSIIKWKGLTYNEIIPTFRRNRNANQSTNNTFLPNPCNIYRRELPNTPFSVFGNQREIKISDLEQPGFSNRTSIIVDNSCGQIQQPYESNEPDVKPLKECVSVTNSLRRVRSSGMNPEKPIFISDTQIGTTYYTYGNQYLNSTFDTRECLINAPNNPQFSCQGAVSYSNYIVRKQYETNTDNNAITAATYKLQILYAESVKNAVGDTGSLCATNVP
jgi:hypothetical protein